MLASDDQQLPGMPPRGRCGLPAPVMAARSPCTPGRCCVGLRRRRPGDAGPGICSLTEGSRFQGKTVAAAFGIQPSQVSRIRSRYREHGARGLVHQMGRPPILSPARLRLARLQAGQGLTHAEIGLRLGVSRSRISELIKQHGTLPTPDSLFEDGGTEATGSGEQAARDGKGTAPGQHAGGGQDAGNAGRAGTGGDAGAGQETRGTAGGAGRARAGRWRGGSSPGLLPAGMRGRCWCTPSPAGSTPRAC